MEGQLSDFCEILKDGNRMNSFAFQNSQGFPELHSGYAKEHNRRQYDIAVDVEDKPGIIATIATALARKGISIKNIGIVHSRETRKGRWKSALRTRNPWGRNETLSALGYSVKPAKPQGRLNRRGDPRGFFWIRQ